jgi:hypothetical protein
MNIQLPPTRSESQTLDPIYLHLPVTDPESVTILSEASEEHQIRGALL